MRIPKILRPPIDRDRKHPFCCGLFDHALKAMALGGLLICSSSCGEDPQLVEKHLNQQAEIRDLEAQLDLLDAKIRNMPHDVSEELKAAEQKLTELAEEAKKQESEAAGLQERKLELEKQLADYRRQYPIP